MNKWRRLFSAQAPQCAQCSTTLYFALHGTMSSQGDGMADASYSRYGFTRHGGAISQNENHHRHPLLQCRAMDSSGDPERFGSAWCGTRGDRCGRRFDGLITRGRARIFRERPPYRRRSSRCKPCTKSHSEKCYRRVGAISGRRRLP